MEPPAFQFYDGGVFESDDCGDNDINHFVLITGWGTDEDSGLDYWILLNSLWGQITSGLLILIILWPGCFPAFSQAPHRS